MSSNQLMLQLLNDSLWRSVRRSMPWRISLQRNNLTVLDINYWYNWGKYNKFNQYHLINNSFNRTNCVKVTCFISIFYLWSWFDCLVVYFEILLRRLFCLGIFWTLLGNTRNRSIWSFFVCFLPLLLINLCQCFWVPICG